jgi:predicted TIM-barrel fold metal-dependent hydrolase
MTETQIHPVRRRAPPRARDFPLFDSHLHIIDPRFPLFGDPSSAPKYFDIDDYIVRLDGYRLIGGAIVAEPCQGFDQRWLADALRHLGPGFVGVANLRPDVSDAEILTLDAVGVRGARFDLDSGDSDELRELDRLARRVHELAGWHVELSADAARLKPVAGLLTRLPAVCIDHFGLSWAGLDLVLRLAESGARVKASGFGRIDFHVRRALLDLCSANPDALMFGTDLPSIGALQPYADGDFSIVLETLSERQAAKVLSTNALAWYRLER